MADWHDDARRIPLFARALTTVGFTMLEDQGCSHGAPEEWIQVFDPYSDAESHADPDALTLDLTDRLTANEALCRLALAMGAPASAVEQGVALVPTLIGGDAPYIEWTLTAGFNGWMHGSIVPIWQSNALAIGITDRPAAIARAWAEWLDESGQSRASDRQPPGTTD